VSKPPHILAEVTEADWAAAGTGWTHLPYMARFSAPGVPPSWESFLKGRYHAVLESGRTGSLTLAVPAARQAINFYADGRVVSSTAQGAHEESSEKPLDFLRRWSREVRAPQLSGWPAFQGGLLTVLGYELASQIEPVISATPDPSTPLAVVLEADEVCIFDSNVQQLTVVILCRHENTTRSTLKAAQARAQILAGLWLTACAASPHAPLPRVAPATPLASSLPAEAFVQAVDRCQAYISAGDTYQVNLSTRLEVPPVHPLQAYEAMRAANPSPYMGFAQLPGISLACGSPELLVEVTNGNITSRPIAGTRPRSADTAADEAWAAELSGDTKERAEHLMLVDLLRNDVGRVSQAGSVRVPEFMAIERYSHVMHLVSQVEGRLQAEVTPADVIRALFPGGTITGAPKVRTMQIISEIEPVARGFYTGSLGWIGASGNLCLNIIIRSLWCTGGRCFVQAGSGIVADSVPEHEHAEALRKAQAPLLAAAHAALPR
jgi:para-aminobenzoate synthetase component 1